MKSTGDIIKDIVKSGQGENSFSFLGTVTSVDEKNATCELSPLDGSAPFVDVRLSPVASSELLIIPEQGSQVVAVKISDHEACVVSFSKIDSIKIESHNYTLGVSSKGIEVRSGLESLKNILNDLFSLLADLSVMTSQGPSGPPLKSADFQLLSQRVNGVLE